MRGCVLCPSRELARQTSEVLKDLLSSCAGIIRVLDIGAKDVAAVRPLLKDLPDIIVGTPGRLVQHLKEGNVDLSSSLSMLVVDEADLIFSFGFETDVRYILSKLPPTPLYQAVLTSATLTSDVTRLKKLVLNNPVILKLSEPHLPDTDQLSQYVIKLEEEDKFILIYALFKLQLVRGKSLIFVNSVDRCYKIKLFLEQFSIPCCVLNSELPVATRLHTVSQFNLGVYDVIVAADEWLLDEEDMEKSKKKEMASSKRIKDKESGVARGIDFQFVANVIHFDFPDRPELYIHRVGRTARGTQHGTALSLINSSENQLLEQLETYLNTVCGEGNGDHLKPYQFKMEELDGLRYRARNALGKVTRVAVRESRLKEIKIELLNSQKLKTYFEDNPRERQLLRHDKALCTIKHQEHLKNVPDYIVPETLKTMTGIKEKGKKKKKRGNKNNKSGGKSSLSDNQKKYLKRSADPLHLGISKRKK